MDALAKFDVGFAAYCAFTACRYQMVGVKALDECSGAGYPLGKHLLRMTIASKGAWLIA